MKRFPKATKWAGGLVLLGALLWVTIDAGWPLLRPVVYKDVINKYAGEYKFDPVWVMALVKVESGFYSKARSPRGAVGLMQLLPSTAQEMASQIGLRKFQESSLRDPDINLHLGFQYLSHLRRKFGEENTIAILAAYNAGPSAVGGWMKDQILTLPDIPYPETRRFVQQVDRTYRLLKFLQRFTGHDADTRNS